MTNLMALSQDILPIIEEMQYNGMPASRLAFNNLYDLMNRKCEDIQRELSTQYYNSQPFNPGSGKQVGSLMRRRGLSSPNRTASGDMATDKKSIEYLRYLDPAMSLVFDWREHQHIRDSFCKTYLDQFSDDGPDIQYIRSNLKAAQTETRRLSAEEPNLLNVPSRTPIGRMVRACFMAPSGYLFGGYDLSQIELRVLAHDSQSTFLVAKFRDPDADVHTETALQVFGITRDQLEADRPRWRTPAKTVNFGLVYGQEGPGLYDQLRSMGLQGWSADSCSRLKREVLKLFQIEPYLVAIAAEARAKGYIRDLFGMYRYLPNIRSNNTSERAEAERHAVSQRIQGTAQGMIQHSMAHLRRIIWDLQDSGVDVRWLLQIHDELIFLFPEDAWIVEMISSNVNDALVNHCGLRLRVPVLAEGHTARSWDKVK